MGQDKAERGVDDRGEHCAGKGRKHQSHRIEGHLVVQAMDHEVEGA